MADVSAQTPATAGAPTHAKKRRPDKASRKTSRKAARKTPQEGSDRTAGKLPGQLRLLLGRCAHPKLALVLALGTVVGALLVDRTFGQALIGGAAVLVVQLVAGLLNDVFDAPLDKRAQREDKPIADGRVPSGNATFVATALFLLAVPISLQSGVTAGLILLGTLVVAFVHNKALHRTPLSFVGWVVTLPMIGAFVSTADHHAADVTATGPTTPMVLALALLGLCLHLITSLRDLPGDHAAGIKPLPLAIALRTGAPKLMYATIALTVVAAVVLISAALGPGLLR